MKYDTMFAKITVTCEGEDFIEECKFHLIPPSSKKYYGTGYYMKVKMSISGTYLVDVRNSKTMDIKILADLFIRKWYGNNAKNIEMWFPAE